MKGGGYKLLAGLFIFGCCVLSTCHTINTNYAVRPARSALHPESDLPEIQALAFHLNDSVTRIYLKFNNENFLYKRGDSSSAFYARIKLFTELRPFNSGKKKLDSIPEIIYDRSATETVTPTVLMKTFTSKLQKGKYVMDIYLSDENRHVRYKKTIEINKLSRFSSQNFLVLKNDSVLFNYDLLVGQKIKIKYAYSDKGSTTSSPAAALTVKVYTAALGPALPPFSVREKSSGVWKADKLVSLPIKDSLAILSIEESGIYQVTASDTNEEGLHVFTVEENFPGVSNSIEMIHCTRYIMAKDEYERCLSAEDPKLAIEKFWLDIGGSADRARELLRKYYSRVKEANKNYSSYLPGWKTDRGMIYIVMGQPFSTFSDNGSETWVYGTEANPNALRFIFSKNETARMETDYVLDRSPLYRDPFHTAVEYWRQGIVYNDLRR